MTEPIFQNLLPCRTCDATFNDFKKLPIIRANGIAEIVVAYELSNPILPTTIRLIGFQSDVKKSNEGIYREGFTYVQALNKEVK